MLSSLDVIQGSFTRAGVEWGMANKQQKGERMTPTQPVEVKVSLELLRSLEDGNAALKAIARELRETISQRDKRIELLENLLGERTEVSVMEDNTRCCWELVVSMTVADGFRLRLGSKEQIEFLEAALTLATRRALARLVEGRRAEPLIPVMEQPSYRSI